ncbi:MAG TPA: SDR family NAD(P)-dependent oxidoreductase, partial [Sporichthyaceae bacterium]
MRSGSELNGKLSGRGALVTGGASGIGAAAAARLAGEGARVVIADIDDEAGEAVAKGICHAGGVAEYFHVDVTDRAAVRRL